VCASSRLDKASSRINETDSFGVKGLVSEATTKMANANCSAAVIVDRDMRITRPLVAALIPQLF